MGWIDVAIPAVAGIVLVAFPSKFIKTTGDADKDKSKVFQVRGGGALLLIAAVIYLFVKIASAR